jgi:hypothetical protein
LDTLNPGKLTDAELSSLRAIFEKTYAQESGVDMSEFLAAERFYRVDLLLVIIKHNPTPHIIARLERLLGL